MAESTSSRSVSERGALRVGAFACAVAAGLSVFVVPSAAFAADEVAACIKNSDTGQELRDQGKLIEARESLAVCARDVCPAQIRTACAEWLTGLGPRIPTMVIAAKDEAGHDVTDGTVMVDGKKVDGALAGKAFPLNPGPHAFRFERDGATPVDLQVVAREGEQRRLVPVTFKPAAPAGVGVGVGSGNNRPPPPDKPRSGGSGPPLVSWVLGGAGLVAVGVGAVVGITALGDRSDLKDRNCAPYCPQSDVDSIRTKFIVSDITVGVGIVAVGAAVVLWLTHKTEAPVTTAVGPSGSTWAFKF